MKLRSNIPTGPIQEKWDRHRGEIKLINPANKRKYKVLVVGTGLAGASAAASLAELGYQVEVFTFHDSPRRAHSIAAQGGINAAKNYQNDGDSVHRLFYDTVKGGDFRAREGNVYRLAQVSVNIIDQCVAQGVPFAREYGGLLDNRSFGGAQVSRTFYARGQTGQQLLIGAYQAMMRMVGAHRANLWAREEMLDIVVVDGHAKGIITRNLVTGKISRHAGDAVLLCTGGYGNVFFLSTNAKNCNVTATYRAYKKGAAFANPCYTQIHPTCIPVSGDYQSKLTLMSESLRNDGRIWVPKEKGDKRAAHEISEDQRDYYLERKYPSFGNLSPRDIASRAAKQACDEGRGVGPGGLGVYLDFADAIKRLGKSVVEERYGNLFEMYERITAENPYEVPMRIYPAVHYTMGGLWVDYNLMSNIPGLHVLGEANFSDHGANRLGASALVQGLADGYFVIPYTLGHYLASTPKSTVTTDHPEFAKAEEDVKSLTNSLISIKGKRSPLSFHRELGQIMWEYCGMSRNAVGLNKALELIPALREEFWQNLVVPGSGEELNQNLEHAGRVADYMEFSELMCRDALHRNESCGGHFREEFQTPDGEAMRNDDEYTYVAAWEYKGSTQQPELTKEQLSFEECETCGEELQVVKLKLKIWRQRNADVTGKMHSYDLDNVSPDMSFLEMLDVLNEKLIDKGEDPVAYEHDCREGICGSCGMVINGTAHGPEKLTTTCQLHMRKFRDGDEITIEPWRAKAFPVIKDLIVDRAAFDRIIGSGGFISVNTGGVPDANSIPVPKPAADYAFDAAACIGCGACVAACPNASAMLFVSAKVTHLSSLPQGQAERSHRVLTMVAQMDSEGFGGCTNHYECEAVCPKGISVEHIARMNREMMKAVVFGRE